MKATSILPAGYTLRQEIKLLPPGEEMQTIVRITVVLLIICLLPILIFTAIGTLQLPHLSWLTILRGSLLTVLLMVLTFMLHELTHALFMYLFSGKRPSFGYQTGMLYATTPGIFYNYRQFHVLLLAPTIIFNLLLLLLFFSTQGMTALAVYLVFILHFTGCAGDLYYFQVLRKMPPSTIIEDTDEGIRIYQK